MFYRAGVCKFFKKYNFAESFSEFSNFALYGKEMEDIEVLSSPLIFS